MNLEVEKEREELEAQANNIEEDEPDMDAPTMHQVFHPAKVTHLPLLLCHSSCLLQHGH